MSDEKVERLLSGGYTASSSATTEDDDKGSEYESFTVAELKAEIASRNEDRAEDDLLSDDGLKADLVATLEADDK